LEELEDDIKDYLLLRDRRWVYKKGSLGINKGKVRAKSGKETFNY